MDYICKSCGLGQLQDADIKQKLLNGPHNFTTQYVDDFDELPFDSDTPLADI